MCVLWDHICEFALAVPIVDACVAKLLCVCLIVCLYLIVCSCRKKDHGCLFVFLILCGLWEPPV